MTPFDQIIDRRGTRSMKWDGMTQRYSVPADEGIAMWVADMDFRALDVVLDALHGMVEHGVFGYFGDQSDYIEAIRWWMSNRHNWTVDAAGIFTTHGIVNAVGLCVDAYTKRGDGVVVFSPVYHAFGSIVRAAGRTLVECPLVDRGGRYEMDFDAYDAQMTGAEKMVILCSPHNPGGRIWTVEELEAVASFARRHDLIILSDEIHHDLVMPGHHHTVFPNAAPDALDRLVMLTAASKTFNLAGGHVGNVIIPDEGLRKPFAARMSALGISPNSFGLVATTAAYSPEGADWLDDLVAYLDGNRRAFDAGIAGIPGLRSMPLEATYLAWVDFADTGMSPEEVIRRVEGDAMIAANHGATFGKGGESWMRFNLGTSRSVIQEAVARLSKAFGDLQ